MDTSLKSLSLLLNTARMAASVLVRSDVVCGIRGVMVRIVGGDFDRVVIGLVVVEVAMGTAGIVVVAVEV